jgi:antitoxin (DNA-binding transcriptional repressor) of toxin-antitoxin stability system
MKTMTVRDVRQKWPEAEKALEREPEIVVTRDGKPVARLLPFRSSEAPKQPVDWDALNRWRARFWRGQSPQPSSDLEIARDRADRESP